MAVSGGVHARPAAAAPVVQVCSWDKPGRDPFVGDVVAAVDRYQDIPAEVRAKLKQRMAARSYDEFVAIERDAIVGKQAYASAIRDMHFGEGRICKTVTRAKWSESMRERGMVYCEGQHCILVPTVCRNVSRITRLSGGSGHAGMAGAAPAETILADTLDGLSEGLADGAADPLAGGDATLLDGTVQGGGAGASNGAITFSRVASGSTAGVAALLSGRSASAGMGSTSFGSPFAGGAFGGSGSSGGAPGGTDLEWGTSPVPEAPAWMMMGAGLLALGWAGRRRAAQQRAARPA